MDVRLKQIAKPTRVKVLRYPPPQAAFLRAKFKELELLELVRPNEEGP